MVFVVNGVDFIAKKYIAFGGLKFLYSDIDDEDAGRTKDTKMHRDRLATKIRWELTCPPLTAEQLSEVLQSVKPVFIPVMYTEPETNTVVTRTMYSNNKPGSFLIARKDGTELWGGVTFPLIER